MNDFNLDDSIDPSVLADIISIDDGEDPRLVDKVIEAFRSTSMNSIDAMVEAEGSGDAALLGRTAHRLKGSSLQVGACRLAALCQELHSVADGRAEGNSGALLKAVQLELRRALDALEKM